MKKIIILSLILMSNCFGASKEEQTTKSKDQEIAALKEACTDVALPSILSLFPPDIHANIKEDIESALNEVNKTHIKTIIDVLTQIITKMHQQQMGLNIIPDVIKWLIIGIDRDLSGEDEVVQMPEEAHNAEQFAAKSVHLPAKSQAPIAKPIHSKSPAEKSNTQKQIAAPQTVPNTNAAKKVINQQPINPKTTPTSKRKVATRTQGEAQSNR